MIPVNKPYLPALDKYIKYVNRIYDVRHLTNNGPLVQELKTRLEEYLGVRNLLPVANGTLAMQIAYKVFNLTGNAVTTPFTFIATSSSLAWEGIQPRFADVNPITYNLCADSIHKAIDTNTTALVPVHVYGNPCDVHNIQRVAIEHNLKVIYDAAHAFGVQVGNTSVLNFGDASTLSFHATKIFHTVEGGAVIFKSTDDYERALLMTNFGINTETMDIVDVGINTKMSEFHAAMGLATLDDIDNIILHRVQLFTLYCFLLKNYVLIPEWHKESNYNGAYMPVTFLNSAICTKVLEGLKAVGVFARRYFSPSINKIPIYKLDFNNKCANSESLAERTLCLPLYYSLTENEVRYICREIIKIVGQNG